MWPVLYHLEAMARFVVHTAAKSVTLLGPVGGVCVIKAHMTTKGHGDVRMFMVCDTARGHVDDCGLMLD